MVFVPVREADALDHLAVFQQIGNIGNNQVNAGLLLIREADAAVHDQNGIFIAERQHVLADVAAAAQRDNLQFAVRSIVYLSQSRTFPNEIEPQQRRNMEDSQRKAKEGARIGVPFHLPVSILDVPCVLGSIGCAFVYILRGATHMTPLIHLPVRFKAGRN